MRWTLLLAVCLLAGCLEEPGGSAQVPDGPSEEVRQGRTSRATDESDPDAIRRYDQEFALTVNPDGYATVSISGFTAANCVLFFDDDAGFVLLNGTAVLTWDAMTPAAQLLAVEVLWGQGLSASGPSPVTLPFQDLESDGFGLGFMADGTLGSVPVMQPVTLRLAFDYRGDLPTGGKGSCSDGL